MANRTVKDAHSVKGTNPQYLVEKIIRSRIYDSRFWKEECFALTAELLVDKAMEMKFIGGVFGGNIKPCAFLCLLLKMLQIQPEKDIVVEFIRNEDFKYVRVLGALYMRLVGTSLDCYKYLEPLYNDYRKLKRQNRSGLFEIVHMDELIDELLRGERACDIILPRIQKRYVLEELNQLEPRVSALEDDLDDVESEEEEESKETKTSPERQRSHRDADRPRRSPSPKYRGRSRSPHKRRRSRSRTPPKRARSRERRREHRESRDYRERETRDKRHRSKSPVIARKSKDDHRRHKHSKGEGKSKDKSREKNDKSEMNREIAEANALRAKLGIAPLRS
uniref:Pre-mRNA-splicing factor 38 n=1 Tax=Strigamia maritima TaxID=126957 RepID=T1JGX1_STRMM